MKKKKTKAKSKAAPTKARKQTRSEDLLERLCRDQVKVIAELANLSAQMTELIVTIKVIGNEVHKHVAPDPVEEET